MATETETAFLVDAAGQKILTEREQKAIRQYLDMPDGPAAEAVEWLLWRASITEKNMDHGEVLAQSIWHYLNTEDRGDAAGILGGIRTTGEIEDLSKEETEILQDTLYAIRAGGWFPEWLGLQVGAIARGEGIPGDRHPTPLQIVSSLTLCIQEHEEEMETARQFAKRRPDLIVGATIERVTTQETPAAEQTTQPATKTPARAQNARKAKRKAV